MWRLACDSCGDVGEDWSMVHLCQADKAPTSSASTGRATEIDSTRLSRKYRIGSNSTPHLLANAVRKGAHGHW
jgi:hypothetical protein